MTLAKNESQFIGTMFEALVELSQERSDVGNESQVLMRLNHHKRSVVIFEGRIIPHAKPCGAEATLLDESMKLRHYKRSAVMSVS
jgi:hypothetical protein